MGDATAWKKLLDAVDLYSNGRTNAAKSIWSGLPESFKKLVLKFILVAIQEDLDLPLKAVSFISPWGPFTLANEKVDSQTLLISELTSVVADLAMESSNAIVS